MMFLSQPRTLFWDVSPLHNVHFVKYDGPVVKSWNPKIHFLMGKRYFWGYFSYVVLGKNSKTCFDFHFPALETLFLEHSKSVKMTRKSQIWSLKVTVSSLIMFTFQPNKQRQIYVEWFIKTYLLRCCSVGR